MKPIPPLTERIAAHKAEYRRALDEQCARMVDELLVRCGLHSSVEESRAAREARLERLKGGRP